MLLPRDQIPWWLSSAIRTTIISGHHLHPAIIRTTMPIQLIDESVGARGERTASAMETQLTALERKIDELLATVASADDRGAEVDRASTETIGNVTGAGEDQSEGK